MLLHVGDVFTLDEVSLHLLPSVSTCFVSVVSCEAPAKMRLVLHRRCLFAPVLPCRHRSRSFVLEEHHAVSVCLDKSQD